MKVVVALAVLSAGAGVAVVPAGATPDASDEFYTPPAGYAAAAPGAILRVRPIQASYMQLIPMPVQAWQLLYRTTGANGQPYTAVTTVLRPAQAAQPPALLSFQNMTDAIAPQCMPSQDLQQGKVPWVDPSRPGTVQLSTMANETPMVAAALARGWTVSVPDTGGVDNHFESPHEPGYVVLDGIRAAESFQPAGLDGPGTRTVLWGYSGGGITSAWAAQEQPRYAPELNLVGAALGGPVGDMGTGIRAANGTPVGGALVPVAMMGMMQDSPEFTAALDRYLTPQGRQKIDDATKNCAPQNLLSDMGFDAAQFLTAPLDQVLADSVISAALRERDLGGSAPTTPLYVYNAIDDEGSAITGVDGLVSAYCAGGTPVTYRREQLDFPVSGHTGEWFEGAPAALAWLQQQVEAPVERSGCDIQSVPATITDPAALDSLTSGIVGGPIRVMLGF